MLLSASQLDIATVGCFLLRQETQEMVIVKQLPLCEARVLQQRTPSLSVKVAKLDELPSPQKWLGCSENKVEEGEHGSLHPALRCLLQRIQSFKEPANSSFCICNEKTGRLSPSYKSIFYVSCLCVCTPSIFFILQTFVLQNASTSLIIHMC